MVINFSNPDKMRIRELEETAKQTQFEHEVAIAEHERKYERADRDHAHEVNRLTDQNKRQTQLHKDEVDRINEQHSYATEKAERDHATEVSELTAKNQALEDLENTHQDLVVRETNLKSDRAAFDAEKGAFGNLKEALVNARAEGQANAEGEYKKGFADGLADGLRAAREMSQADRDAMVEIAGKIVDKPTPKAPDVQILALPTGKSNDSKKN